LGSLTRVGLGMQRRTTDAEPQHHQTRQLDDDDRRVVRLVSWVTTTDTSSDVSAHTEESPRDRRDRRRAEPRRVYKSVEQTLEIDITALT